LKQLLLLVRALNYVVSCQNFNVASLALISPTVTPHGDFSVVVLQVSKFKSTSEKQLLGFGLNDGDTFIR